MSTRTISVTMKNGAFLFSVFCLLAQPAAAAKIKIACIGNSITYGYGANWDQAYPYRLQQLLGTDEYEVQNDGVNATTLLKQGDNSYYKNGKLPDAFGFQPDIITIKLGTNDSKPQNWNAHQQEFKEDYLWLIDTLQGMASRPKIWLVLPVPVFDNPVGASWGIRDSIVRKIIPLIKEVAAERELPVIDMYEPLQPFPQYFSVDGVHPDAAGLDSIAHVIYRVLKEATSARRPAFAQQALPSTDGGHPAFGITVENDRSHAPTARLLDLAGREICRGMESNHGKHLYRWNIVP